MADAFVTTVVGSMPKPAWLQEQLPLNAEGKQVHGKGASWNFEGELLRQAQDDAVRLAIHDQELAGVDIVSDGEQRRSSYLTYITQRLDGVDYETLGKKWTRNRRRLADVGRCVGPVRRSAPFLVDDLKFTLAQARASVKVTLPGPMTVVDTILDEHYGDEETFAMAVAAALNAEARALDALGPLVIQFDEPVFSRYPEKVEAWGITALDRCLQGLEARTAVHVCYSYPMPGVPRPIQNSYPTILAALESSMVDELSLEFEASRLDSSLLRLCPSKTVMFGCIDNGTESIETPQSIADKLLAAAEHLPADQIQAAPDCGLVPLPLSVARAKLTMLVAGARLARTRINGGTKNA